jgi:hypothetical protein
MTIQPGAEPAELASTLDPWYRLADAVSASTEVTINYSAEHGMTIGTGGQWWAWRIANPISRQNTAQPGPGDPTLRTCRSTAKTRRALN